MKNVYSELDLMADWIVSEVTIGNDRKARRIYKVFCRFAVSKYPRVTMDEIDLAMLKRIRW